MDSVYSKSDYYRNIMIYPEGSRFPETNVNPIKKGALIYSFEKRVPVQIIVSRNKEVFIDEKKLRVQSLVIIRTYYSDSIDPMRFETLEKYIDHLSRVWCESCSIVYNETDKFIPNVIQPRCAPLRLRPVIRISLLLTIFTIVGSILSGHNWIGSAHTTPAPSSWSPRPPC